VAALRAKLIGRDPGSCTPFAASVKPWADRTEALQVRLILAGPERCKNRPSVAGGLGRVSRRFKARAAPRSQSVGLSAPVGHSPRPSKRHRVRQRAFRT